jgi:tRNA A-37 threonylcarbamoyl transferase component Bud32/ligand-binding sensor domain-containing protein
MAWRAQNSAEYVVRKLLFLGLILLLPAASFAQHYPVLPIPNSPRNILAMMQDSKSRLWLGTADDVYCFDGIQFYSIRQYGLPTEAVTSLAEDSDGGIWIGTKQTTSTPGSNPSQNTGGGLYRFYAGRIAKLHEGEVFSVAKLAPRLMLASFRGQHSGLNYGDLVRFKEDSGVWTAQQLLHDKVFHLTVDAQGTTFFPCPDGWCRVPRQEILNWSPTHPLKPEFHALNLPAVRILRDRLGFIWIRADSVAGYIAPDSTDINKISLLPIDQVGLRSSDTMEETPDGSILLLDNLTIGRPNAFHTARARNGIPSSLNVALASQDGTIWLANDEGLFRFMYPFRLEYWTQDNGLESPYSIARVGDQVFVAEGSAGITQLDRQRSYWNQFVVPSPGDGIVVDLMAGPNETLLITTSGDLAQLDMNGKRLAQGSTSEGGMRLARTWDGQLWLGGDNWLSKVTKVGDKFRLAHEDLPQTFTADLESDSNHVLWACHGQDILFREKDQWQSITSKDGLLNWSCISVAAHPNGDVWLGYMNQPAFGVIRHAASDHRTVQNFFSGGNIGDAQTNFFEVDHNGWLWRGSNTGIYVADSNGADSANWLHLDKQDGLPALDTNQQAFYTDQDGSIWFGAGNTVTHFSPGNKFATEFPTVAAFISGFSLDGKQAQLAEGTESIPHGTNLVAHIGSLQFDRRNALHFRYRILPGQSTWISTNDFNLNLGTLSWGTHHLQVQAQMDTGPWSNTAEQSFTVLKPIWLTWPALTAIASVGAIFAFCARRWSRKRKARAKRSFPELAEWRMAALSPELHQLDGTLLDSRFEVGRILARGGFATVTEGVDTHQNQRRCAIKIFRQDLADKEWMARRFQQEVRALEQIHHPNVVSIYGSGIIPNGSYYLAMEFIEGETLRDILEARKLPTDRTADYLRQSGSALDQIHKHGICHRDLKPENIMIRSAAPSGQELALIDFSIAIVKDPDETMHGLSRAAGTLHYMAPEQAIGYANSSTDIYSLAKILIEMLTGKRLSVLLPDASMDLPDRVFELLSKLPIGLTPDSMKLLSSALEFDPSRRPKHAGAFANQIAEDLEANR